MSVLGSAPSRVGRPAFLAAAMARALLPVRCSTDGGRPDEGDAGLGARLGEVGVLGEEAVAGVDRVGAGLDGGPHDPLGVEVGADRVALLADPVGLVGLEDVLGLAVLVGEDGDRLGAELGGGAERADRDLTSVRDEDLAEHLTSRGSAPGGGGAGWGDGQRASDPSEVPTRETARPRCGRPAQRYAALAARRVPVPAARHTGSCRGRGQLAAVNRCRRCRGCSSSSTRATA